MGNLEKKRIEWIDIAKCLGILLIIIGHYNINSCVKGWIYSFHVPLFFFLSGFCFSNKANFLLFVKKKVKGILLPYLTMAIIICLFQTFLYIRAGMFSIDKITNLLLQIVISNRLWTLWFLTCLFVVNILFYLLSKYLKQVFVIIICIVMPTITYIYYILGGNSLPWNVDASFMALFFFAIGYYLKQLNVNNKLFSNKKINIVFIFVFLACNIGFYVLNHLVFGKGKLDVFDCQYGILPLTYLSALCGIGFIIELCQFIHCKLFRFIGENTLIFMGLHQSLFMSICGFILTPLVNKFSFPEVIEICVSFVLVVICCSVMAIIFNRTKLRVLLGKF